MMKRLVWIAAILAILYILMVAIGHFFPGALHPILKDSCPDHMCG
jgi:hypothetical protein